NTDDDDEHALQRVLAHSTDRHSTDRNTGHTDVHAQADAIRPDGLEADGPERDDDEDDRDDVVRVSDLRTELQDVTDVEYRQVRLENVVLIGIYTDDVDAAEASLRELAALTESAGARVLDGVLQRRLRPDAATFFGSGKAKQLKGIVAELQADTVVADSELAPSQRRALEDVVGVKVIDRTAVILDIFSQHAASREGKAEVELARLEYLLPRLRGWGESMSRQAGGQVGGAGAGMGSRGPGETQMELDRRRIRMRMARLRKQIANFAVARETKRASRVRNRIPSVAIVGYTNAGKSSLLNRLASADVVVENALFATLDPTVRRATSENGVTYTFTDTVGFIRHLPHQLVEAFRSTLEEIGASDIVVHVVDAAHPDPGAQITTVRDVLGEIGARHIPEIVVFNKVDLVDENERLLLRQLAPECLFVSTRTGEGIEQLLARISDLLPAPDVERWLLVPYDEGDVVSRLHVGGRVLSTDYREDGTVVHALVPAEFVDSLNRLAIAEPDHPGEQAPTPTDCQPAPPPGPESPSVAGDEGATL
ncbi:MAG: hflX, partial [Microbacteriaceae bacterium]|nr:hflX [Microbacteriaceae bacterium]